MKHLPNIESLAGLFPVLIVYLFLAWTGIGCPLRFLTGISCAGCGMSRALWSFLHGNISAAFAYHPLFPLVPLTAALYLLRRHFSEKLQYLYIGTVIIAFIVTYLIRMIKGDPALVFDPANGFIVKLLSVFLRIFN